MARVAMLAAEELAGRGVDVEVVDLRSLNPLDAETILRSVEKTRRLVTADGGWGTAGVGAEVAAVAVSGPRMPLKAPVARVGLAPAPAPMSRPLEAAFYPTTASVGRAVE